MSFLHVCRVIIIVCGVVMNIGAMTHVVLQASDSRVHISVKVLVIKNPTSPRINRMSRFHIDVGFVFACFVVFPQK